MPKINKKGIYSYRYNSYYSSIYLVLFILDDSNMKKHGYTLYTCDQCRKQEFINKDTPAMNWVETVITYNPMFVEEGNDKQYVTINNTKQFCKTDCLKQFILDNEALQKARDKEACEIEETFMRTISTGCEDFVNLETSVQDKLLKLKLSQI